MKLSDYYTIILGVAAIGAILFVSCGNKDMLDTNYTYDTAVINTQDQVITVRVKQWTDYEDGDQIQITADDGTVYLVHSSKCTLIHSR